MMKHLGPDIFIFIASWPGIHYAKSSAATRDHRAGGQTSPTQLPSHPQSGANVIDLFLLKIPHLYKWAYFLLT